MTSLNEILNRDSDEGVVWARNLSEDPGSRVCIGLFDVLMDINQDPLKRVRAASVLNALGSSRSLPRIVAERAYIALLRMVDERNTDIRRTGIVAISSILHRASSKSIIDLQCREGLKNLMKRVPSDWEWEKSVVTSLALAMEVSAAKLERVLDPVAKILRTNAELDSILRNRIRPATTKGRDILAEASRKNPGGKWHAFTQVKSKTATSVEDGEPDSDVDIDDTDY
jgi:hypothetical protein